jgi:hypothetical protein
VATVAPIEFGGVSAQLAVVADDGLRYCRTCEQYKPAEGFPKKWKRRCGDCYRHYMKFAQVKLKYGMGEAEWMALYEKQHGGCAICGSEGYPPNGLVVDHDHATGRIRGLLCDGCNTGIAKLKESPELLRSAASYLA